MSKDKLITEQVVAAKDSIKKSPYWNNTFNLFLNTMLNKDIIQLSNHLSVAQGGGLQIDNFVT